MSNRRNRNAACSFCRKNYRDVGPLVEGPGDVYICGECIELCQSIIDQEKRRRTGGNPAPPDRAAVWARLDHLIPGRREGMGALAQVGVDHLSRSGSAGPGAVLLVGPSRVAKALLARALAHVLDVPFAEGDGSALASVVNGEGEPLFYNLLFASDFDIERAQRGIVYVDGVDQRSVQEALIQLWLGQVVRLGRKPAGVSLGEELRVWVVDMLFVCGGEFSGLDPILSRMGRHPEQPLTPDILEAAGMLPELARHFKVVLRVAPLEEEMLARLVTCVDFDQVASRAVEQRPVDPSRENPDEPL